MYIVTMTLLTKQGNAISTLFRRMFFKTLTNYSNFGTFKLYKDNVLKIKKGIKQPKEVRDTYTNCCL